MGQGSEWIEGELYRYFKEDKQEFFITKCGGGGGNGGGSQFDSIGSEADRGSDNGSGYDGGRDGSKDSSGLGYGGGSGKYCRRSVENGAECGGNSIDQGN